MHASVSYRTHRAAVNAPGFLLGLAALSAGLASIAVPLVAPASFTGIGWALAFSVVAVVLMSGGLSGIVGLKTLGATVSWSGVLFFAGAVVVALGTAMPAAALRDDISQTRFNQAKKLSVAALAEQGAFYREHGRFATDTESPKTAELREFTDEHKWERGSDLHTLTVHTSARHFTLDVEWYNGWLPFPERTDRYGNRIYPDDPALSVSLYAGGRLDRQDVVCEGPADIKCGQWTDTVRDVLAPR